MKFDKLGWVVAAALAGAMFGLGFQPTNNKFASVDIATVFNNAKDTATNNEALQSFVRKHYDVLNFLKNHPVMLPADVSKYPDLKLKPNPTPADTQELNRIEGDAVAAMQKQQELVQKANPTADDLKQLNDYSQRMNDDKGSLAGLEQRYDQEAQKQQATLRDAVLKKVKDAIRSVAVRDGYTIVFNSDSAPYAANDITPDCQKAVDK
jgi:Skp family chaperone for outer membrane proteins